MSDAMTPMEPPVTPDPPTRRPWLPQLRSRWWTLLLGVSLMANLLVIGLALGFGFEGRRAERLMGASYIQMIPRDFLRNLPRERREELMGIVHDKLHQLRELRATSDASPLKLAEALEKPDASDAEVRAAVEAFATGNGSLAAGGAGVTMEIVSKLTPDERKALAHAIRDRAERAARRRRN